MVEETVKEITSAGEPPRGLISSEFFFLLQRIDRLDEKFEARFEALDKKFEARFEALEEKFEAKFEALEEKFEAKFEALEAKLDGIKFWAIGAVITVIVGFAGTIVTLVLLLK